ncbi:MAG: hypothetical protein ACK5TU_14760 [Cyclobacteriaceae bacterium]|jgi:hypothetical protein
MKVGSLLLLAFLIGFAAYSQKFRIIELKPIVKQGAIYYYDLKRVHGGAYGLQIPLQSLDDNVVNRYYKSFRGWKNVGAALSVIPGIYLISISSTRAFNGTEFLYVFGGTIVGFLATEIVASSRIKKGVDRYNTLVIGVSGQVIGPSITYKF